MLCCGSKYNPWVTYALKFLPSETIRQIGDKLAFYSTAEKDACRVARSICEQREIILLSERILPKKGDDSKERYFIFVVLHEIVHVVKRHRSPLLDSLTPEESEAQEKEADELALSWFNDYVKNNRHLNLLPLTPEEIDEAKRKNQERMRRVYEGG